MKGVGFKLSKYVPFYGYRIWIKKQFMGDTIPDLVAKCPNYTNKSIEFLIKKVCFLLILAAEIFVDKEVVTIEEQEQEKILSIISEYLSFSSPAEADEKLYTTPYIKEDFMFNLLQLAFYSLVLINPKIMRRFETAYILWQNSKEFGVSGYSSKMGKYLPYYVTSFGNRIFVIDPIKGVVKFVERRKKPFRNSELSEVQVGYGLDENGKKREVVYAVLKDGKQVEILEINEFGGIKELVDFCISGTDRKMAEREQKRKKGQRCEDQPWLTTDLDMIDGSAYNIRTHSFICLMVYGLDVMKYGIMDGHSIFTVDHINGVHNDNRIDNLQLLTRKSNEMKKENNNEGWYMDYFSYWTKQIAASEKLQDNLEYRIRER